MQKQTQLNRKYPQRINKRYIGVTVIDRMFNLLEDVTVNDCWIFGATKDNAGYAKISFEGSLKLAHRIAESSKRGLSEKPTLKARKGN